MRNKRFITKHRGGSLSPNQHRQLILWACRCAENAFNLFSENIDEGLNDALQAAKKWEKGEVSTADARKQSVNAISIANERLVPGDVAIARSVGHAVATAHMADHAIIAAYYALKAFKYSNLPVNEERKWQNKQLPPEIRDLVLTARELKEKNLKI